MGTEKLDAIRKNAEAQDITLTRLLAQRARYLIDPRLYLERGHPILRKDSCLCGYIASVYLPILEAISPEGEIRKQDLDRVVRLDREIAYSVMKRTSEIGELVAQYKAPRGLPTYVPTLERKKIRARIAQSKREKLGLTEAQIAASFALIFAETKRIEGSIIQPGTFQATGGIRSVTTDCEDMIEPTKRELQLEGEKLGGQHSVGVSKNKRGPRYIVTLY